MESTPPAMLNQKKPGRIRVNMRIFLRVQKCLKVMTQQFDIMTFENMLWYINVVFTKDCNGIRRARVNFVKQGIHLSEKTTRFTALKKRFTPLRSLEQIKIYGKKAKYYDCVTGRP